MSLQFRATISREYMIVADIKREQRIVNHELRIVNGES